MLYQVMEMFAKRQPEWSESVEVSGHDDTWQGTVYIFQYLTVVCCDQVGSRIKYWDSHLSSKFIWKGTGELQVHFTLWRQVIRISSTNCFNLCFPGIGRMSDWGLDINSKIDSMVLGPRWGVELLWDGDWMELISHWYSQANERTPHSRLQTLAPANHL